MVFSSMIFLCAFFPIVFILYQISGSLKWKNALLIAASLLFYTYGEPVYILLMMASILFNYLFGRLMKERPKKGVLIAALVFNLGLLFVFKYLDMVIGWINLLFSAGLPVFNLPLPVGISFFTFQALSYVIDVYRREVEATDHLWVMMLYISFFPQLIAGPIVKYHDIEEQIQNRSADVQDQANGLVRFIVGLSKKVLVANTLASVTDTLFALPMSLINAGSAWLGAICYLFQIYFDFSGYSDMAIGMGRMFGFHIRENFRYPYISRSIKEFWRRWHISLTTWFREYLYIPLGGNRKGKVRTDLNKLAVFTATGIWHGANLTFLLWGWWHGFFMLLEDRVPWSRLPRILQHVLTMLIVIVGFVMFRADTVVQGLDWIRAMFTGFFAENGSMQVFLSQLSWQVIITLLAAALFSIPWKSLQGLKENMVIRYGGAFMLLFLCVLFLASGTYNPFIYFRF